MKNNYVALFCIFFISTFGNSQNFKISKIIVDKTTKLPLENISIYNDKDNSTTNQEGLFVFVSDNNEINFNLLGYNLLKTTFDAIKQQDTIFLQSKAFELKEIVVANLEPFIKKVYDKMGENYISNYTSNFFLRNVLKKDNSIVVLQDINAKRGKNANPKNSNEIEVLNMIKAGFNNVNIRFNTTKSIIGILKTSVSEEIMVFLFIKYC